MQKKKVWIDFNGTSSHKWHGTAAAGRKMESLLASSSVCIGICELRGRSKCIGYISAYYCINKISLFPRVCSNHKVSMHEQAINPLVLHARSDELRWIHHRRIIHFFSVSRLYCFLFCSFILLCKIYGSIASRLKSQKKQARGKTLQCF